MKKLIRSTVFLFMIITVAAAAVFSEEGWITNTSVYYFTDGYPEYIQLAGDNLLDIPQKEFKPWTAQIRLSGFAETNDRTVLVVNAGYPLFSGLSGVTDGPVSPERAEAEEFVRLTEGRTVGTVYSEENHIYIHLYCDNMFSDISSQAENPGPVIVRIDPADGNRFSFSEVETGFEEGNPGWEPVEFIRKDDCSFIAWKYTDDKKTRFRYIRHDENGLPADEIDEKYFRDEYSLQSMVNGPFALRGFIRAVREGAAGEELRTAGAIYLRLTTARPGEDAPLYYYSPAPPATERNKAVPMELPACRDGEVWYILSGDEILLCGNNIRRLQLPGLPADFEYRELWVSGDEMIVSWEETRFLYTGRSGMMYIKMRDILNGR